MQLPIDVSAVISEAANLDKEKTKTLSVGLYFDPTASDEALAWVHDAFTTKAENVTVHTSVLDGEVFIPTSGDTIACIVAGTLPHIGHYAEALRSAGTPVMVVSFDPQACMDQAQKDGHPLLEADVVSPSSKLKKVNQAEAPATVREALELRMGQWVVAVAKTNRLAFALAFPFVRKPLAHDAIQSTSMQNALVGVVFLIPGADLPIMTLNQAKMVLIIAAAYGQSLGVSQIKELAAVIAGGFACRTAAREISGLIPALGWAVKGSVGYGGTMAMGYAALKYYEHEAAKAEGGDAEGGANESGKIVEADSEPTAADATHNTSAQTTAEATDASQASSPFAAFAQAAAGKVSGAAKKATGAAATAASNAYVTVTQSASTDGTLLNKAVSKAADVAAEALKIPGVATFKDNAEGKVRDSASTIAQAADVVSSAAAGLGQTASKVAAAADSVKRHLS